MCTVICILIYFIKCSSLSRPPPHRTMASFLLYHCVMGARNAFRILIFLRRAIWLVHSPSLKYISLSASSMCPLLRHGDLTTTQAHILRKSPYGTHSILDALRFYFESLRINYEKPNTQFSSPTHFSLFSVHILQKFFECNVRLTAPKDSLGWRLLIYNFETWAFHQ